MLLRHVATTDVVQVTIVGLADDSVDRDDTGIAVLRERPFHGAGDALCDRKGIGEDDGSFDLAQFRHLRRAGEFSEPVADSEPCWNFVLEQVAGVRKNGGHPGAHCIAVVQGDMANGDTSDVGDRVERTRAQHTDVDAQVSRTMGSGWRRHDCLL